MLLNKGFFNFFGHFFADAGEGECIEKSSKWLGFRCFNLGENLFDSSVRKTWNSTKTELLMMKLVEVCDIFYKIIVYENVDVFFAQAVDVHTVFRDEVFDALFSLGGATVGVGAVNVDVVEKNFVLTLRAVGGFGDGFGLLRTRFGDYTDNIRDNFARALNSDAVVESDVFLGDEIEVVETGSGNRDTAEFDGGEVGDGGDDACAADLVVDGFDGGGNLLGWIFVGDGSAGVMVG